ncbi:MAG: P-loop NTPase [bacterium]
MRDYIQVIRKRMGIILLCVALLCVAGVFVNFYILKVKYQSVASILVEQPPRVLMLTDKSARVPPPLSIETQMKLIRSLPIAEAAAKKMNLPVKNARGLLGRVIVKNEEDTGIINIIVESPDPKECAEIANSFARAFEEMSQAFAKESVQEATQFISDQLEIASNDLTRAEDDIKEFSMQYGAMWLDEDASRRNEMITRFEVEKVNGEIERRTIQAQLAAIERMFNTKLSNVYQNPESLIQDSWLTDMRENLTQFELERVALLTKYTEDHPKVQDLDKRIQKLLTKIEKGISDLVAEKVVFEDAFKSDQKQILELHTQLLITENRIEVLKDVLAQLKHEQESYPELKYKYSRLVRTLDVAEKLYILLYEKHQQARIDEVQQDVKVKVFEEARIPTQPVSPQRKKNILIMTVFGLLLGVGLAFLLEEMEETIHSSDDVRSYLNLPVLGSIPYSAETINKLITDVPLKSPIAEAYRRLSFFTQLFCLDPPIKSLLVTSSKSDEGKSTTLANLAISMAQEGTKVLMVDTDLRRPMLHRMFNIDNSLGLSSILTGELEAEIAVSDLAVSGHLPKESLIDVMVDRIIQPLSIKGLSIIPAGPLPANSIELLRSERMLAFLRTIDKKADLVLFDSPPSIHVIDAVVLAQILDGVLFVINAGRVNKDEALQVKYMIESTKTPIIGVALNNIVATSPDYYYYYYYGGYGYGTRQRRKRVKLKR